MMFSSSVYSTSNKTSTSLSDQDAATSTVITSKIHHDQFTPSITLSSISNHTQDQHDHLYPSPQKIKKKRNLPGNPGVYFAKS